MAKKNHKKKRPFGERVAIALSMAASDHPDGLIRNLWLRVGVAIAVLFLLSSLVTMVASGPQIPEADNSAPSPAPTSESGRSEPTSEAEPYEVVPPKVTPRNSPDESREYIAAQGWGAEILQIESVKDDPEKLRSELQKLADSGKAHVDMPAEVNPSGKWPETAGYPKWTIESEGARTLTAKATYPMGWSLCFVVDVQDGDVKDDVFYATKWSLIDIMYQQ